MDSSDECELLDSGIFDVNSMVNDDKNEAFLKTLDNDKLDLLVWIENLYENHSKDGIYLNRESHSQGNGFNVLSTKYSSVIYGL